MSRLVVVGGGIAGLAAAWEARQKSHDVVIVESDDRLGGKIRTSEFAGRAVDEGADAFITRTPHALELARELEIDLVHPGTGRAYLWSYGELRPIPEGTVLGVPVEFDAVAEAGVLSPEGLERARQEPDLPGDRLIGDAAIGELVSRRFGREVAERLVDPLLGGINAGGIDHLSVRVAAPQLAAVAERSVSLARGLAAVPRPAASEVPVFAAPAGGMQVLVDRLAGALSTNGVDVRTGGAVTAIDRAGSGHRPAYRVETAGGPVECDAVVVATPAFAAAPLVDRLSDDAAAVLRSVDYASVALVTLAYRADDIGRELDGSGFLVPRPEGRLLTACSWFSSKWPHLAGDPVILRASVGRYGDDHAAGLPAEELVERIHAELAEAMAIGAPPAEHRVSRWSRAFPQFGPGHLDQIAAAQQALTRDAPAVALAGSYVRGVGIPACIASGQAAALDAVS